MVEALSQVLQMLLHHLLSLRAGLQQLQQLVGCCCFLSGSPDQGEFASWALTPCTILERLEAGWKLWQQPTGGWLDAKGLLLCGAARHRLHGAALDAEEHNRSDGRADGRYCGDDGLPGHGVWRRGYL